MTISVAKAILETEKAIEPNMSGYVYNSEYFRMLGEMAVKYMDILVWRSHRSGKMEATVPERQSRIIFSFEF